MPAEKRTLRSNRSDASADGEKPRSNSQSSSSNKDKAAPTRPAASRGKAAPARKPASGSKKPTTEDASHSKGSDAVENGVNGSEDVQMSEEHVNGSVSPKQRDDNDGDEEMTVVVPPSKTSRLSGEPDKNRSETKMDIDQDEDAQQDEVVDPVEKAQSDIRINFTLLERAVVHFDLRFTLRVLRTISSMRKHLSADLIASVITTTYQRSDPTASFLLAALDRQSAFDNVIEDVAMEDASDQKSAQAKATSPKETLPEIDVYLSILVQIYLYDEKCTEKGAEFSQKLVEKLRTHNRRTLDCLAARAYFYYSLFFEQLKPLPPSPTAAVISIRPALLAALRTAVLRKDTDIQATVTTLLLRNYLSTSHISQADLFISHSEFPVAASNNQIARYLYYLGRIRAIQLRYTDAHQHLVGATRKSPSSLSAGGFYQASMKLLVVVELLMGDIPDRAIFRQAALERSMYPYFLLVRAVSVGDLDGFQKIVQTYGPVFRKDSTYTLILRLRQNVIKTGIRMMSLSYTRISLRDICLRLGLDSEESAEYIVAKAIRDGVIEASLDHEQGYMKSKDIGDVYATQEPGEVFHERIQACLGLHDESVKAMRFPMNQHRLELKNAQEARERERELAKEIVEGDMDDDDAGGDFDGI
ncbi:26S proteasome non-ATPase regulatory subunit [Microsporum canis]|uniref:26S proteasome non-ATPase regulatory subunit 3 n=1 Tax=Arthroderma otae (strain ATCC MYA-4605 / CBS 113480) TaxID=554155 RepID=C5FZL9_ARTOC|nr:26S proteasome non-ATPase regulatory subunit 3 [Microsporum canis CBS 113480]EEQ35322.1 26S proteasome non-ATPase regulatory subunit 3 [Microsporum canis CBS 113480]